MNNLRCSVEYIQVLCAKLTEILDCKVKDKSIVEIDKLFGQLTVDVICEVAFQLNINALSDATAFQVSPLFRLFNIYLFLIKRHYLDYRTSTITSELYWRY